jgi:hypothetical protein
MKIDNFCEGWLTMQSQSNLSLHPDSLICGESAGNFCNLQGIWPRDSSERTARLGG